MSLETLLIAIAIAWILLALLGLSGWGRRRTASRRAAWDLTRDPAYWFRLEARRRRQRNDQARGRVRVNDAGETASRPARRESSKDDCRRR